MALQNNPLLNRSPTDSKSFAAGMRKLLDLHALKTEKMIPAKVLAFDRGQNIATVQPLIMLVDTNDQARMRNQIAQIPVLSLGGGSFHISFPLKAGDLGWILASDRDISQFMTSLTAARPNSLRTHKFSDAWFIPDVFRQYTINSADTSAMVIQSTDGTTRISISEGIVNITAPTSVKVDTPKATFTHDVEIQGNLMIDQNLTVTGMTAVNGGFNGTGTSGNEPCTLPQDTTIGGIAVYGHGHIETAIASHRTSGGMVS